MIEFAGTYNATIDDKGRVVLPSAFKKELGELALEQLVIEKNLHRNCLDIHPQKFWNERVKNLKSKLDLFDAADDGMLQFFYQNFTKASMAPNGRINIPGKYLDYAKLEKEVQFIGMGEFIRVMAVPELEKNQMTKEDFLQKLREKLQKGKENA